MAIPEFNKFSLKELINYEPINEESAEKYLKEIDKRVSNSANFKSETQDLTQAYNSIKEKIRSHADWSANSEVNTLLRTISDYFSKNERLTQEAPLDVPMAPDAPPMFDEAPAAPDAPPLFENIPLAPEDAPPFGDVPAAPEDAPPFGDVPAAPNAPDDSQISSLTIHMPRASQSIPQAAPAVSSGFAQYVSQGAQQSTLHVASSTPDDITLNFLGYDQGIPLNLAHGSNDVTVVANEASGAFPSFKVKVGGKTVGLFKPVPDEAMEGAKAAPCFKKAGSCEAREIFSSAWNESLGSIGDFPKTIPATIQLDDGRVLKGSVMAWRNGSNEFSQFVELPGWKVTLLEVENYYLEAFAADPAAKLDIQLDNEQTQEMDKQQFDTFMAGIKQERARLPEMRRQALSNVEDSDAQGLMALHLSSIQLDTANASNIMFQNQGNQLHLFAIDGGLSAPDQFYPDDFLIPSWGEWPVAQKPWTNDMKVKLINMPPVEQAARMTQSKMGDLDSMIEVEALQNVMGSTQLLRMAAQIGASPLLTFNIIHGNLIPILTQTKKQLKNEADKSIDSFARIFNEFAKKQFMELSRTRAFQGLDFTQIQQR